MDKNKTQRARTYKKLMDRKNFKTLKKFSLEITGDYGLTAVGHDVYQFLRQYKNTYGVFPTLDEIAKGQIEGVQILKKRMGRSNIHRILNLLVERQVIEKQKNRARAMRFVN